MPHLEPPSLQERLQRLSRNVVDAASVGREVIDVGPFRALISPDSDLIYMNYAVPVRGGRWSEALPALCDVFRSRRRVPRFEYYEAQWPTLAGALEAAGFELEISAPVMTVTPEALVEPASSGATIRMMRPEDDLETFAAFYETGARGFGIALPEPLEASMGRNRPQLESGSLLAALAWVEGQAAACGSLLRTEDVAELAGVATVPAFRRRGIAAELCARLVRAGFGAGVTLAWLSAGSREANALYAGLGFETVGAQRHYSVKGGADPG